MSPYAAGEADALRANPDGSMEFSHDNVLLKTTPNIPGYPSLISLLWASNFYSCGHWRPLAPGCWLGFVILTVSVNMGHGVIST